MVTFINWWSSIVFTSWFGWSWLDVIICFSWLLFWIVCCWWAWWVVFRCYWFVGVCWNWVKRNISGLFSICWKFVPSWNVWSSELVDLFVFVWNWNWVVCWDKVSMWWIFFSGIYFRGLMFSGFVVICRFVMMFVMLWWCLRIRSRCSSVIGLWVLVLVKFRFCLWLSFVGISWIMISGRLFECSWWCLLKIVICIR